MTLILVKFTLANGATGGYIKIDRRSVRLDNGRGEIEVDGTKPYHTVTMWFDGVAGSTLEYELSQDLGILAKGKVAISFGQVEGVVSGRFNLRGAA